ncbi:MAG: LppX_LprAFG lipoprotein [Thermoleophilia bacterium]
MPPRRLLPAALVAALALAAAPAAAAARQPAASPVAGAASGRRRRGAPGRVRTQGEIAIETPGGVVRASFSGTEDPAQGLAAYELDLSQIVQSPTSDEKATVRLVVDGERGYLGFPSFLTQELGSKAWIALDQGDFGTLGGNALAQVREQLAPASASAAKAWLRGVGNDVQAVGKEAVEGVQTTRYRGTIDFDRAIARTPEAERAAVEARVEAMLERASSRTVPAEVWLDEQGRVRQVQVQLTRELTDGVEPRTQVTVTFLDYGEPVEVTVPDPADVTPYADVAATLEGTATTDG